MSLRDEKEIQRAHDILHFLGTEDGPPLFDENGGIACQAAHDALSWVLGFPCGETFAENLQGIFDEIQRLGYTQIDAGRPLSPEEQKERGL